MKVALVHDYLREQGEAERILTVLHRIYPAAALYTAFLDRDRLRRSGFEFPKGPIHTTWADCLPGIRSAPHRWRSLIPIIWESLDLADYDLVISSSGPFLSHGVLTRPETLHIAYCHSPSRSLWEVTPSESGFTTWEKNRLRQYDFYAAQRVDHFVTHSERVARRIRKWYRRSPELIMPPVPIQGEGKAGHDYYLYIGPITPALRPLIEACNRLERPLWILGQSGSPKALQTIASPWIRVLSDRAALNPAELYAGARALICTDPEADFAFPPVEAMGHGVPVIAPQQGGYGEILLNHRTGILYTDGSTEGLIQTIQQFEGLRFSAIACLNHAQEFAEARFITQFEWFVAQRLDEHRKHPKDSA